MTDEERVALIDKLNQALYMKHRTAPYILTKSDDFKEYLTSVVATYMDYCDYYRRVVETLETMTHTIEASDPVCADLMQSGESAYHDDLLPITAVDYLICVELTFRPLLDLAEINLKTALLQLLFSIMPVQDALLGEAYYLEPEAAERLIEEAVRGVSSLENQYVTEKNYTLFMELFKDCLAGLPPSDHKEEAHDMPVFDFSPSAEYDRTAPDELRRLLVIRCGQYFSYYDCWKTLSHVYELFDETLEYSDPVTWASMVFENAERNDTAELITCFSNAEHALFALSNHAQDKLEETLSLISQLDPELQREVTGSAPLPNPLPDDYIALVASDYNLCEERDWNKRLASFLALLRQHE